MDKETSSKEFPLGNSNPRVYEKPVFEESEGLQFTREIWIALNAGRYCMQCSGCHGCR